MNAREAKQGQGFDQLNAEPAASSFAWNNAVWVASTAGQQAGQKEPFARGLIRTDDLAEGDTVWAGCEFQVPASTYASLSRWLDGPLRGINWRTYPGTKDNVGLGFEYGFAGATGALKFSSWRDGQPARAHGGISQPTPDVWHTAEIMVTFSRTSPRTRMFYDGAEIQLPGATLSVYDWSRPFVINDWQFGLVGTSGNPAPLRMLVKRAYVAPTRLWATPAPEPELDPAVILTDARAHMARTTITYATWLKRKASGYYSNPDATEWAKAEALLDQLT